MSLHIRPGLQRSDQALASYMALRARYQAMAQEQLLQSQINLHGQVQEQINHAIMDPDINTNGKWGEIGNLPIEAVDRAVMDVIYILEVGGLRQPDSTPQPVRDIIDRLSTRSSHIYQNINIETVRRLVTRAIKIAYEAGIDAGNRAGSMQNYDVVATDKDFERAEAQWWGNIRLPRERQATEVHSDFWNLTPDTPLVPMDNTIPD